MKNQIYAEEINYWKTGRSAPDTWIEKTRAQIEKLRDFPGCKDAQVFTEGFGKEVTMDALGEITDRSAYMLGIVIGGEKFKVVWPVLPTKSGKDGLAAKIQAATMLYHDIKAKCMTAAVLGARTAFFSYLLLEDGRTAAEASIPELSQGIPKLFLTAGK